MSFLIEEGARIYQMRTLSSIRGSMLTASRIEENFRQPITDFFSAPFALELLMMAIADNSSPMFLS